MKHLASLALLAPLVGCTLPAQEPVAPPPPITAADAPFTSAAPPIMPMIFSAEQLDQLLGPIALYPDALIALMLPASTNPSDIGLAARYVQMGGNLAAIDAQPWDESVRALAHYPEVIKWMDQNFAWTRQLGDAFTAQSADVMNAIQRLRARARAAGTLVDTAQQQVVYQEDTILIVPTQPDVIYVPYYDPAIVYVPQRTYYSPSVYFGFSSGFAAGWWLSYGLDWHQRYLWEIDRHDRERYWREHQRDWHRHYEAPRGYTAPEIHRWQPHPEFRRPIGYPPTRPTQYTASTTWSRPTVTTEPRRDDPRRDENEREDRNRRHEPSSTSRPTNPGTTPSNPTPSVRPRLPATTVVPPVAPAATPPVVPSYPGNRGFNRDDYGPAHPDFRPHVNPPPAAPNMNAPVPPPQMRGTVPPYGSAGMPMPYHHESPSPPRAPAPAPQASPSASSPPATPATSQTTQSNDNDDGHRHPPPFIRPH